MLIFVFLQDSEKVFTQRVMIWNIWLGLLVWSLLWSLNIVFTELLLNTFIYGSPNKNNRKHTTSGMYIIIMYVMNIDFVYFSDSLDPMWNTRLSFYCLRHVTIVWATSITIRLHVPLLDTSLLCWYKTSEEIWHYCIIRAGNNTIEIYRLRDLVDA